MTEEELQEEARKLSIEVLNRLFELSIDGNATEAQVMACAEILDRAWGKVPGCDDGKS
jgi:hypothetical protein